MLHSGGFLLFLCFLLVIAFWLFLWAAGAGSLGLLNSFWFIWWGILLHLSSYWTWQSCLIFHFQCHITVSFLATPRHAGCTEMAMASEKLISLVLLLFFFSYNIYKCKQSHVILHKFNMCEQIIHTILNAVFMLV